MGWEEEVSRKEKLFFRQGDLPVGAGEATQGDCFTGRFQIYGLRARAWESLGEAGAVLGSGIPGFAVWGLAQVALGPGGFFLRGCPGLSLLGGSYFHVLLVGPEQGLCFIPA